MAPSIKSPLPKDRGRIDLHRHPYYYAVRNHIVDFLVSQQDLCDRSRNYDPRQLLLVRIGLAEPTIVSSPPKVVEAAVNQAIAR